jgi:small subunit ribosomal protein S21
VEDSAVLDVGVGADADGVDVAAQNGVHPDGGVFAQGDVADQLGGEIDVAGGVDLGRAALVGADHGRRPFKASLMQKSEDSGIIKTAPWQVWRWDFLAEVRVQEGEPLENALRRFKRKVQQEDIIKEVKRHSYYLKPGEKRRVKAALARKRNRKKARKEAD